LIPRSLGGFWAREPHQSLQIDSIPLFIERNLLMEHAAALLVQTIFNADTRMQALFKDQGDSNPESAAEFFRPWYQAMLMMIKSAEDFNQGPTQNRPGA
jgi:hypothetical protein